MRQMFKSMDKETVKTVESRTAAQPPVAGKPRVTSRAFITYRPSSSEDKKDLVSERKNNAKDNKSGACSSKDCDTLPLRNTGRTHKLSEQKTVALNASTENDEDNSIIEYSSPEKADTSVRIRHITFSPLNSLRKKERIREARRMKRLRGTLVKRQLEEESEDGDEADHISQRGMTILNDGCEDQAKPAVDERSSTWVRQDPIQTLCTPKTSIASPLVTPVSALKAHDIRREILEKTKGNVLGLHLLKEKGKGSKVERPPSQEPGRKSDPEINKRGGTGCFASPSNASAAWFSAFNSTADDARMESLLLKSNPKRQSTRRTVTEEEDHEEIIEYSSPEKPKASIRVRQITFSPLNSSRKQERIKEARRLKRFRDSRVKLRLEEEERRSSGLKRTMSCPNDESDDEMKLASKERVELDCIGVSNSAKPSNEMPCVTPTKAKTNSLSTEQRGAEEDDDDVIYGPSPEKARSHRSHHLPFSPLCSEAKTVLVQDSKNQAEHKRPETITSSTILCCGDSKQKLSSPHNIEMKDSIGQNPGMAERKDLDAREELNRLISVLGSGVQPKIKRHRASTSDFQFPFEFRPRAETGVISSADSSVFSPHLSTQGSPEKIEPCESSTPEVTQIEEFTSPDGVATQVLIQSVSSVSPEEEKTKIIDYESDMDYESVVIEEATSQEVAAHQEKLMDCKSGCNEGLNVSEDDESPPAKGRLRKKQIKPGTLMERVWNTVRTINSNVHLLQYELKSGLRSKNCSNSSETLTVHVIQRMRRVTFIHCKALGITSGSRQEMHSQSDNYSAILVHENPTPLKLCRGSDILIHFPMQALIQFTLMEVFYFCFGGISIVGQRNISETCQKTIETIVVDGSSNSVFRSLKNICRRAILNKNDSFLCRINGQPAETIFDYIALHLVTSLAQVKLRILHAYCQRALGSLPLTVLACDAKDNFVLIKICSKRQLNKLCKAKRGNEGIEGHSHIFQGLKFVGRSSIDSDFKMKSLVQYASGEPQPRPFLFIFEPIEEKWSILTDSFSHRKLKKEVVNLKDALSSIQDMARFKVYVKIISMENTESISVHDTSIKECATVYFDEEFLPDKKIFQSGFEVILDGLLKKNGRLVLDPYCCARKVQ